MKLEQVVKKEEFSDEQSKEVLHIHFEILTKKDEITLALEEIKDNKKETEEFFDDENASEDSKKIVVKEIDTHYESIVETLYHVHMQESFYQAQQLAGAYERSNEQKSMVLTDIAYEERKDLPTVKEDLAGEMKSYEAQKTIQRIIRGKLFNDLNSLTVEEKERFRNWRLFNKATRRFYESLSSLKYRDPKNMPQLVA